MYVVAIVVLMLVCPAIFVMVEAGRGSASLSYLIGKWFVFWAVGIRMAAAGLRQMLQPAYTAREIFGIQSAEPYPIVREVGFGTLSMGTLAICSLFRPEWIVAAALVGGLYYGMAGLMHFFRKGKNVLEQTAMLSDLLAMAVLVGVVMKSWR